MNVKKIIAIGAMSTALVGAGSTSAFAATSSTSSPKPPASTCLPAGHDDVWPASTNGRPARDPGVRVWHDSAGWHVRATHNALHDRTFSGEIVTTGTLIDVHAVRLEKNDSVKVGPNGHTLLFRFNNYGGVDGFDFVTRCAPFLQFGFVSDGHVLAVSRISVGAAGVNPAHDPFVIRRTA